MAKDSRHIVLHAKGNQRRQWSSDIPRQVKSPNESPFFRAFFSGFTTKEHGYLCNDYDMFFRGKQKYTGLPETEMSLFQELDTSRGAVMARPVGQWSSEAPPGLPGVAEKRQMQAEVEGHQLIQTLFKVAFHAACGSSSLCSCFYLMALDWESHLLPLQK